MIFLVFDKQLSKKNEKLIFVIRQQ